ncbi:MAG TPA: S41 family peptidase [Longimicrobiaceae bacterium]|nr:S41 family peptidase [Longimicrobiaceae bacterium]
MKLKRTVLGPVLVGAVALASGGWLLQQGGATPDEYNEQIFDEVVAHVQRDYVDEHSPSELYKFAIDGMLRDLGDPHTNFLTRKEYNDLRVETTGEYGGLGIQIAVRNGWITVIAPLPGTPAERAGLRAGDRIVEVEGKSTAGWTDDQAVKVLRGPKGAPAHIKVARPGVDEPIAYTIVRDAIHVNSVTSYMVSPDVGLVRLSVFAEGSAGEIRDAMTALRQKGAKKLILDLRTNPGGLLDQGVQVADLFLKPGQPIVSTHGRDPGDEESFSATRPEADPGVPMIVLVDDYTASAAEIVSGALQDHDRALVIGQTTFGKGSVQTLFPLSGGNFLKMTTARWYTPSGRSIQKAHEADAYPETLVLQDSTQQADTAARQIYHTDSGRVVYGGGGIVPDVIVQPDSLTPAEKDFFTAAAKSGSKFNDVVFRYAVDYVRQHPTLKQDFAVTPAMRQEFFDRLTAAGVPVTQAQFAGASDLVGRRIGYEIALAKWGTDAASRRATADDKVVRTALDLLHGVDSEDALFQKAGAMERASR